MLSTTPTLYLIFLASQLYALTYHFYHPSPGLVHPFSLHLLKILSTTACLLSWTPNLHNSSPAPLTLASTCFLASLALFAWTAAFTRPRKLAVIYGRVTPRYVMDGGPFAYVRHPTYVAYTLGWMGALVRVVEVEGGIRAGRVGGMLVCVGGLFALYRWGAVLEERQFLEGQEVVGGEGVQGKVQRGYEDYMRRVGARWIPGVV